MSDRILATILAIAASAVPSSASGMSEGPRPCQVLGGEKLPASTGGASGICDAIEEAIAAEAPNVNYRAEVRILSHSAMKATVHVNGRQVADQQLSVMDRKLNASSIERFAKALAVEVAKASKS
jgi:hypothetical protein